ncbi:MAG: SDR family oxidoreductase [Candidatus Hydrogenedentota bacterium]
MARFLITGGAGFIGSNLAHALLAVGHDVRVLDDFATGRRENLAAILERIELIEGSITDETALAAGMRGVDYCLHQAAIPSVPRSVQEPVRTNRVNVEGSLRVFLAAREAGVRRVVYASSSSVYGNAPPGRLAETLPRAPISPYAVSKATVEQYAAVFHALYAIELVGLRYFNVFGPRQDAASPYAAVIPRFMRALYAGEPPVIYGDGAQARDFTHVDNVVLANLRAATATTPISGEYNVACGESTSLRDLAALVNEVMGTAIPPVYEPPRPGDIRDSRADIGRAKAAFDYEPVVSLREGLAHTAAWYAEQEGNV